MSPRERNRNVPLSWWPRRRLPIGKDRDECEGTDTSRGAGPGEGGRVDCEIGGGVAARQLPPGEAIGAAVSGGRGEGTEAPERGTPVESCAAHGRPGARAAAGPRNDLGGRRCVAPVDRGVRRAAGALYGLEKRLCARAECGGTGDGGRAPDAVWPDVRVVGDSDHRGQLAAGEGARRAESRDPSGSPREEIAAVGDRGCDGGECVPGDD